MYCPDCGTQILPEHEFCRSCGADLRLEQKRIGISVPFIGVILAFVGILIALTGRMLLQESIVVFVGVVISILGMMSIALTPMLSSGRRSRGRSGRMPNRPQELTPADTTTKLPPISARDQVHSVVEDTTELLKEPAPGQIRR